MCGLIASFVRGGRVDEPAFHRGLARLAHRGPDATGAEFGALPGDPTVGYALGHQRLSILDTDPRANQPLHLAGRTLLYNGEIYDYRNLARRFLGDATLRSTGDSEVLLALLSRFGPAALAGANGMWAYVLMDRLARKVMLARDAYGKKPLFYRHDGERFAAASELGPLLAETGARPVPRPESIIGFLADGWLFPDPSGATHLEGIREVRPGHGLTLCLDTWRVTEERLWSLPVGPPPETPQAPEHLASLLSDAVLSRLVSDRPVGLLLSGGVDSSLILAVLSAAGRLDGVTSYVGDAGKSDDADYARACVDAVGARTRMVPLDYGPRGLADFLLVCRRQEKPFPLIGNVLGAPALYEAMAADGVPVALDGAGADEIFGGYWTRYGGLGLRDGMRAGDDAWTASLAAGGQVTQGPVPPAREALPAVAADHLKPDVWRAIAASPPGDPLAGFAGSLPEAMRVDAEHGRLQEWLWQNDRSAMTHGVENRSPFLDERLAPFIDMPAATKFDGPWNKPMLRALFPQFTPLPTATRRDKQGFRWVYGRFLRNNHAALFDLLAGSRHVRDQVTPKFFDDGRADSELLASPLAHRLLVLAGLEAEGVL